MNWSFRQPAEAEKNPRHDPDEPGRSLLFPPGEPTDERQSEKRNVQSLDLDEAALFDDAEIC